MVDLVELRELHIRLIYQENLDLDDYNDREILIDLIENEIARHISKTLGGK